MSAQGVHRQFGEGGAWAPQVSTRARVENYHVQFARARRPHTPWPALARMLGVNELDLRRACGDLAAVPGVPEPEPAPPPAAAPKISKTLAILLAIREGGATLKALDAATGQPARKVGILIVKMKARGLLKGDGRLVSSWSVTEAGAHKLAAWEAEGRLK
jgi:hypothetical protein